MENKKIDKEILYEIVAVLEKQNKGYEKLLELLPKHGLHELYNFCKNGDYKVAREYIEKKY